MSEAEATRNGTYKCPVCGHRDSTDLAMGAESVQVSCSYCEALLEVTARGSDSIRFQAQVVEET